MSNVTHWADLEIARVRRLMDGSKHERGPLWDELREIENGLIDVLEDIKATDQELEKSGGAK